MNTFIPEELYQQILGVMPIPCVDLVVSNPAGLILLVKRANEPAKGQWWFPGGRVHLGELRKDAAKRKLLEECNLLAARCEEIGTFDVILEMPGTIIIRHGITSLFFIMTTSMDQLKINHTATDADWRKISEWEKERLHPFVRQGLSFVESRKGSNAAWK